MMGTPGDLYAAALHATLGAAWRYRGSARRAHSTPDAVTDGSARITLR
jgi:hypothetical protein